MKVDSDKIPSRLLHWVFDGDFRHDDRCAFSVDGVCDCGLLLAIRPYLHRLPWLFDWRKFVDAHNEVMQDVRAATARRRLQSAATPKSTIFETWESLTEKQFRDMVVRVREIEDRTGKIEGRLARLEAR